jgi:hypothetical protein
LRDGASKMVAEGAPLVVAAAEELKAAADRRERIERGENVSLPGKPPGLKELGITPAHARHMTLMTLLSPEQFERYLKIHKQKLFGPGARRSRVCRASEAHRQSAAQRFRPGGSGQSG